MSDDLDEDDARELVQQYLQAREPPLGDEWTIAYATEYEWGWVVGWNSRRYLEGSRDPGDIYAGGGPYLVDRHSGEVAMAGSAHPVAHYIELWESGQLPSLPRPA